MNEVNVYYGIRFDILTGVNPIPTGHPHGKRSIHRMVMGTSRHLFVNLGPVTTVLRQAITRRRPLMSASDSASTVGMAVTEDKRP